jgi:NAD+ synthase
MWDHKKALKLDCKQEASRICAFISEQVSKLKRDGAVIGLSGGIDSTVCAELCSRALGKDNVLGIILPERESNPVSAEYASIYAQKAGLRSEVFNITPALEGLGAYAKRDSAIKANIPEYNVESKAKITLPDKLLSQDALNYFTLQVQNGRQNIKTKRLDNKSLRQIVAATSIKQRLRMVSLYYYAEANNFLVCGTTNRNEYIQGFFVKHGDGGVDIEPIVHLYKTQVYQLAQYFKVMDEIIKRAPSPDTFSFTVSDEEMYFRMSFEMLDPLLYAWENDIDIKEVCQSLTLQQEQIERAFRDFRSKYNATEHLRQSTVGTLS